MELRVFWCGKESMKDKMVTKMMEEFYMKGALGVFNQNQTGDFCTSFEII